MTAELRSKPPTSRVALREENKRLRDALRDMSLEVACWKRRALIHNHSQRVTKR